MSNKSLFKTIAVLAGVTMVSANVGHAQTQILSTNQPTVEYQYQMYYPRVWGWPGPGWSMGGTLPANTREGVSSFYGRPLPVPLGAGVYMNPFAYSAQLPGPMAFGLSAGQQQPQTGPGIPTPLTSSTAPQGNPSANAATPVVPFGQNLSDGAMKSVTTNKPAVTSSDAAIAKSREIESYGDANLKSQQWMQAYINYRNAVITAGDRADAHARLGLACVILQKYPEAVVEFKRAFAIDPTFAQSSESLASLLGPESQAVRAEILKKVAAWARGDLRDQDRLFLLGLVLHYDRDVRSDEILAAAMRLPGNNDHIVALMMKPTDPSIQLATEKSPVPPSPSATAPVSPTPLIPELPPAEETAAPVQSDSIKLPTLHHEPIALH